MAGGDRLGGAVPRDGRDPEELTGSPRTAAITSFLLFAFGAMFPVLPFAFLTGVPAVATSVVVSSVALCGIGAAITIFTGRPLGAPAGDSGCSVSSLLEAARAAHERETE